MTLVFINPGTGPVRETLCRHAVMNMRAFRRDLNASGITFARYGKIEGGRYPFLVRLGKREVVVEMPGLPLERVRYMNAPGQNAWHFPRLYVDGSSWLWEFAVPSAREALGLETLK